ncbi:uncharacterized protein B0T23DRAFT_446862 [Neurospora hispaniola]|uniref:Uncharacterized protein n=1 Tax=Neurospora hispaniola TaxID=588809 RepID=A0AAJ0I252_9PEZI|nr:hypothetical protein B0T23DRAFT_446862 [Neurospora hispaniola]
MSAPAQLAIFTRILPRMGLRWNYHHGRNILQPERRDRAVNAALHELVGLVHPNMRMTAKREVERLLVDIVDTSTRLVRNNVAMLNPYDFMAGIGMTGVGDDDFNIWNWEDDSFLEQARVGTELGELLSPHTFQALFLAMIEARQRFLSFAAEHLPLQDPSRRCLLAAAVDRFLEAAVFWDVVRVPIQLQIEEPDDEEMNGLYSTDSEEESEEE